MKHTLLALTLTASSAFAQQPAPPTVTPAVQVDPRFAAWLGCWRLDDDLAGTGARMCITPEKGGVRLQTVVGTQRGIDEVVIPDNVAHAIIDSDCKGTERAEWSKDGARLFRATEVACGKEAPRTINGVAFMAPGPSWLSVQYVTGTAANPAVRVQRYRRAANQQLADGTKAPQPPAELLARVASGTKWDVADVIEASSKVPAEALQASLAELHQPFDVNKKTLVALDEGGVHEAVIDLMVALTYPKRFVVKRAGGSGSPMGISTGSGWFDPFMGPMLSGTTAMLDCYSPYGYGYRSYYSMCGSSMSPYGLYGYNYYNNGYYGGYRNYYGGYGNYDWVNIGTLPSVGSGSAAGPQPEGRVVNGRGYTQIHDRQSEPAPRVSSGGGANGSAAGWSGNGNGGGVSSGGYSAGSSSSGSSGGGSTSSGDSGARVAVPKGGGGQ